MIYPIHLWFVCAMPKWIFVWLIYALSSRFSLLFLFYWFAAPINGRTRVHLAITINEIKFDIFHRLRWKEMQKREGESERERMIKSQWRMEYYRFSSVDGAQWKVFNGRFSIWPVNSWRRCETGLKECISTRRTWTKWSWWSHWPLVIEAKKNFGDILGRAVNLNRIRRRRIIIFDEYYFSNCFVIVESQ